MIWGLLWTVAFAMDVAILFFSVRAFTIRPKRPLSHYHIAKDAYGINRAP
jgi:hypothetical protein